HSDTSSLSLHDALPISQVVAHRNGAGGGVHLFGGDDVAHGLRHLLALVGDHAVVQPEAGEAVACGGRLGQLVLVVGETQVQSTADRKSTRLNSSHVSIS